MLSDRAAELYRRLLRQKIALVGAAAGQVNPEDPGVIELDELGLLVRRGPQSSSIGVVSPAIAFLTLLSLKQDEAIGMVEQIKDVIVETNEMQREFGRSLSECDFLTDLAVISEAEGIAAVMQESILAARYEFLEIGPATPGLYPGWQRSANSFNISTARAIYTRNPLGHPTADDAIRSFQSAGEQQRFTDEELMPMRVVDGDIAFLSLRIDDPPQILVVRSPAIVNLMRSMFEFFWENVTESANVNDSIQLTATQRHILALMAAEKKDIAIANATNVSVRTVRRHFTKITNTLKTRNRFAVGVQAVRRGWLPPPFQEPGRREPGT